MIHRLPYEPKDFVLHQGVKPAVEAISQALELDSFQLLFIEGAPRAGKTHLSVFLTDYLSSKGSYPRMLEGEMAAKLFENGAPRLGSNVVLIDDADHYLSTVIPGRSGPFVAFVEQLRIARGKLILFSTLDIEALPCDQHVLSRLRPGLGYRLENPSPDDMHTLVNILAHQRGIKIEGANLSYLERRLPREISLLEMYLERVSLLSEFRNAPVRLSLLKDAL